MFIISEAFADQAPNLAANNGIMGLLPLLIIPAIFYFFLIRPQVKKHKELQSLVNSLRKGDKVITSGGLIGTIAKIEDEAGIIHLEIAPEIKIRILKSAISEIYSDQQKTEIKK